DAAHAGEHRAAGLERVAGALGGLLGPLLDLLGGGLLAGVEEAAVGPVPVRAEHAGVLRRAVPGPVQVAADVVAPPAWRRDLLDGVAVALEAAVDDRLQRRLLRQRPEAGGDQDALADLAAALVPLVPGGRRREREVAVEVFGLAEPGVGGLLAGRQDAGGVVG